MMNRCKKKNKKLWCIMGKYHIAKQKVSAPKMEPKLLIVAL